ncbi:MAG: Hsp20 family protein [Anaerolineae bacterium]
MRRCARCATKSPTASSTARSNYPRKSKADKIEANLENGILTVRAPKAEAVKPRTIKIQAK